jgi:hypothetical protein
VLQDTNLQHEQLEQGRQHEHKSRQEQEKEHPSDPQKNGLPIHGKPAVIHERKVNAREDRNNRDPRDERAWRRIPPRLKKRKRGYGGTGQRYPYHPQRAAMLRDQMSHQTTRKSIGLK